MKCLYSPEIRVQSIMKIGKVVALQPCAKYTASEGCGVHIWKYASPNEGKGLCFCHFLSLMQLFEMEIVEAAVRLILKALSLALWISLERVKKLKEKEKLGLK